MAEKELTPEQMKDLSAKITALFSSTNIEKVTQVSTGFDELPEGYFALSLLSTELKFSRKDKPQAVLHFEVIEDGYNVGVDDRINRFVVMGRIQKTKGRKVNKYYNLETEKDAKTFVSDMLKFQIDEAGGSLPKEAFERYDTIHEALTLLEGCSIFCQNSISENKETGEKSSWLNLITFQRAKEYGLMDVK